jgi:hypothetical protein
MDTSTIDAAAILRDIEQAEADRLKLADLSRAIGWSRAQQSKAIAAHLIDAEPGYGPGKPYTVTKDEARTLLFAAVLAIAAGVAIAVMLRGVKGANLPADLAAAVFAPAHT